MRPNSAIEHTALSLPRLIVSSNNATRIRAGANWLASYPSDAEVLVLAATREAGDDFVRHASVQAGARFGLTRTTLDRLAVKLAAPLLARDGRVPATNFSLLAVAARAVHLLMAEDVLAHFAPVARRPGLPAAMARTLDELRMNGVDPALLHGLSRGGGDLAKFAGCVERELQTAALADRAAIFEAAIESVRISKPPPVGFPTLLLDVPVASGREAELIAALAQTSPNLLATAAQGDKRTIRHLEKVFGCTAEELNEVGQSSSSLSFLKRHLFEESAPAAEPVDSSVSLISWPGEARECVEIARAVQAEAERGKPFDRMAVFLRSPGEYRPHLEEAFRRAAIPAYFARGTTAPDPAGRAFLALLSCATEKLSARRFAEYLSLSQVPDEIDFDAAEDAEQDWAPPEHDLLPEPESEPQLDQGGQYVLQFDQPERSVENRTSATRPPVRTMVDPESAPNIEGALRSPWRWEQLLVEAAVIGGRDRWERRLAGLEEELRLRRHGLAEEDETRAELIGRQLIDLGHLRRFALPVIDVLAAFPERAVWSEWIDRLRSLAVNALREPEHVLATLSELEPAGPVGPVDLDEVQLVLGPRLRELMVPPPPRRYGAVFIGPVDAARGIAFDVVFVPGLAEKLFPRKIVEDPILLDDQRRRLQDSELTTQAERVGAERLALKLAVGAATEHVYLTYPRVDMEQARPRVPSFYGLEAMRAAEGHLPGFDELGKRAEAGATGRLGWPAPQRPEDAIDEAEYDLALLSPLLHVDEATSAGTATYLLSSNPHLARALRARARRWLRRWTVADGLVDPDPFALEALANHQLSARSFSPTALQNFAICPYRFFLQAIHRLEPREDPVAIEVIDPLTRGALFHDAQFEILTRLKQEGLLPLQSNSLARAISIVDTTVDRLADTYAEKLAPAIPRVWEDGINSIRADLREWLRRAAESQVGWVPHRFELSFGLADRNRPYEDPASVPDSIPVTGELRLRGSIDLVERDPERGVLRATDHKTGKVWTKEGVVIGGGGVLQPVFYALACEKLLGEPVEAGRLYYCTTDGGFEERVVPLDNHARVSAEVVTEIVSRALSEGFFPAAPDKGACVWCDYISVCGTREELRVRRKPAERLSELNRLRCMP